MLNRKMTPARMRLLVERVQAIEIPIGRDQAFTLHNSMFCDYLYAENYGGCIRMIAALESISVSIKAGA